MLADRGYDADWIRERATKKDPWANIPRTAIGAIRYASARISTALARVEQFFHRIKQCRRFATRDDRLAANYLAFVQLASTRLWLRLNGVRVLALR
ncbi:transposase [Bradyrhizobium sp. CCBAU 11361]|nr:transposase [Bradyrhizobium sp. CCBAU 11361]